MKKEIHPANNLPLDQIEMLNEPLIKDGEINPECMVELEEKIRKIGKTYKRLENDPEWTIEWPVSLNEILGNFAKSAISCGGNTYPKNLENLTEHLRERIKEEIDPVLVDGSIIIYKLSICEINELMWKILGNIPHFQAWNTKEVMGGDWIDLDAVLHNICIDIRNDRRHMLAFDREFEREHPDSE